MSGDWQDYVHHQQEDEDADHQFRDKEEERKQASEAATEIDEPQAGEMTVETMLLGGFALDERVQGSSVIKQFLTKASSLETASTGVGDLVRDGCYDAQYDKEQDAKKKGQKPPEKDPAKQSEKLNRQVMMARMLVRQSQANVARKADLIPKGKVIT